MVAYNPNIPLTFIHVPKTAGTATTAIFKYWFKDKLLRYYGPNTTNSNAIRKLTTNQYNLPTHTCIYGHFNTLHQATNMFDTPNKQCIMIVRDPWEKAKSAYYYHKCKGTPKTNSLEQFIKVTNVGYKELTQFKPEDDYKEIINKHFIYVGVINDLDTSIKNIATLINMEPPAGAIPFKNVTPVQDEDEPLHLKQWFIDKFAKDYEIYEYCCNLHKNYKNIENINNQFIELHNNPKPERFKKILINQISEHLNAYKNVINNNYDVIKNINTFTDYIKDIPVPFLLNIDLKNCIEKYIETNINLKKIYEKTYIVFSG